MQTITQSALARTTSLTDNLTDWAEQFLQAKTVEGVSPNTVRFYRQQLRHFLAYCDAQVITGIEQLTPQIIRQFMLYHSKNHNPGGVHAAYRILKTFLRFYETETDWAHNPIYKVKPPKLAEVPLAPVELSDVRKLINVCQGDFLGLRDRAIFLTLLDTGARAREFLAVNLRQVNLTVGSILIAHGKGAKPRTVYTSRKTRKAIRSYLRIRFDDSEALWITDDSKKRLSYSGLRGMIVRRSKEAGVSPHPGLHDFRRGFALECLRNGMDLMSVATLLGHSDLKTVRRYLRLVDDDLRNAHNKYSPVDSL